MLRRHLADELKQIQIRGQGPVLARQLYAARAVEGVESARPIYAEWPISSWKNPQTGKIYAAQVLAFDPDQPVFLFPEVREHLEALRQPDTALSDRRGRRLLGFAPAGTLTELSRREIRVIGNFSLGPDFDSDGTVPASIAVRTKAEWLAFETAFQNSDTPVGPIFMLGTALLPSECACSPASIPPPALKAADERRTEIGELG